MSPARDTIATTDPTIDREGVFGRLAFWSQRHRRSALLLWILAVAVIAVGAQSAGSAYRNDFTLPGTDSQAAADLLKQHGSAQAGGSVQIVFKDTDGLSGDRPAIEQTLDRVRGLPGVADVRSPYADASAVSENGTIGYATVVLDAKAEEVPEQDVTRIIDTAKSAAQDGLMVELGGDAVRGAQEESGGGAEGAGMFAALVILVLLFGSVVAAALPLVTALLAVGGAIGLITLASHVLTVADFTPPIMMLVGLGVGVDYALLIFYRYRHELIHDADRQTATRTALDTAGRTVFIAGCTVIIALLGLVALGLGSLQGVAVAVALTVLVTMAASLTLLPALLALFGNRIQRHVLTSSAKAQAKGREEGGRWRQLASAVQRHPLPALLAAVVALLALSAPALGMRLGFADAGNDPASSTSRRAYDLLAEGFGAGFNGPLLVVSRGDTDAAEQLRTALTDTEGIAAATPPLPSPDGTVFTVIAFPTTSPQDASTAGLVHTLRNDVLHRLAERTGADYLVGGPTAAAQDFADAVSARIPLFVAIVVGLSALLLMLVFRSVLIPLKAALLNLLSIAAALGVITLVFQYGWFGVQPGPVEAFIPVMIFAIVFGLSMDYEVFLISRIHEEWEGKKDHSLAVREGLAATGKVITAAAAIMIVVFAAFVLSPNRMLQQFGLGLAVAIFLDAVVIRCLIVPAVMQLFGTRAWWLPAPLARHLPKVALERPTDE
ncbi:MMPL family transporter [Streptomyces caniscabiei]|uniref:MMPL family transporter n=1 Tax=Streptomyces caniscabiei TaxID=2746961 RepID=UPI0029A255DA|nr:MMPL family transporter [Streptomyces caniscabiei]MDX2604246.1 MMPL family transporter [Streptomyces caniscabiei]MDX2739173.1 MMPL family transporter [Streptomyces caniscabiei]MDX2783114.1 MMPL family transporter [Streptomyces caniscabiei]